MKTKFRGKSIENGDWVFGYYVFDGESHWIYRASGSVPWHDANRVDGKTVGQFTGLEDDRAGDLKEIYDGDILAYEADDGTAGFGIVTWGNACWTIMEDYIGHHIFDDGKAEPRAWILTVVGNKFDNPELIESCKVDPKEFDL